MDRRLFLGKTLVALAATPFMSQIAVQSQPQAWNIVCGDNTTHFYVHSQLVGVWKRRLNEQELAGIRAFASAKYGA